VQGGVPESGAGSRLAQGSGLGMIVPVSRSIMNAPDPRAAAAALRDEINQIRKEIAVARSEPASVANGSETLGKKGLWRTD